MQIKIRVDLVSNTGRQTFVKVNVELGDNSHAEAGAAAVADRNARSARNGESDTWTVTGTSRVRI